MEAFVNNGLNAGSDDGEEKELRIYVDARSEQAGATLKLEKLFFAETEEQGRFFAARAQIKKGEIAGSMKVAGSYGEVGLSKGDVLSVFVDANDPRSRTEKARSKHGFNTIVQIVSAVSGISAAEIVKNTKAKGSDYLLDLCSDETAYAGKEFKLLPAKKANDKGFYEIVYTK